MRRIRGNEISMIFQEPMTSLNPVFTIGDQIVEALRLHRGMNKKQARTEAIEALRLVGIPNPEERVEKREMHTVIDLDMRHQRIKDRGFLREPDDNPALGNSWSLLAEGGLGQQIGREDAGSPA